MKKTKRIYTPITNIKHMVSILESRGERTMFDYFDAEGNIRKITYRALAARVTAFGSGLYRLGRIKGRRHHRRDLAVLVRRLPCDCDVRRHGNPDG